MAATKAILFLLACSVFIAITVSSVEEQGYLGNTCVKNRYHYPECSEKCTDYCDAKGPDYKMKTDCQRICSNCCTDNKCVPGPKAACYGWTETCYEDKITKCP
ncbi:hypothetical protein RHMOL_Rhmol08G0069200 [Rhododendron molle]|uniref:Uncharacterized protein n=1 Tax=Rhododendron molle TaxID=49168 RepID=A0ACC0MKM1_RHOML|nr:hypothetical protein RHMOL_Rhmol08G0069200 [Rhododendron molle]